MVLSLIHCVKRHAFVAVLLTLAVFRATAQENPAPKPQSVKKPSARIRLSLEQIPEPPKSLPILKLSAQKVPTEFVQETARRVNPKAEKLIPLTQIPALRGKGGKLPEEVLGAFDGESLVAYVDLRNGDAEIFPSLGRQKGVHAEQEGKLFERAEGIARELFARDEILEKDATQFKLEKPLGLYGETAERGAASGQAKTSNRELFLSYVRVRRSVNEHYVYGPGSRAMLVVGIDGGVQGFLRHWKTGTVSGEAKETRSREQVAEAIRAELRQAATSAEVEVLGVEIAYYDGNRNYMQPVYKFTARIAETNRKPAGEANQREKGVNDDFVIGYVPIGKELEPVPSLATHPALAPLTPEKMPAGKPAPGDPTVGRYVVRHDNANWVASANEFWGGLTTFFGGFFFTNSQYYWAYPIEFNTSEASFVNSVNVALNEVHGDWWLFSTEKNCCDLVDITAIPASEGYGAANHGHLDFWVLHSCEVVPSAIDAPCPSDSRPWWTPWFNVFQGLHTAVGYRTIMWIDDDVTGPFAVSLRFGAPVVSAWFNATTSAAGYQGNPTFPAHCGRNPPMGRPSTVSVCGRENDWIYDTSPLPPANCLINYWQPN